MKQYLDIVLRTLRPAPEDAAGLLERRVLLAKFILLFEQVWRALLWPFVLAGGFVFLSLLGLWNSAPGWLHSVGLLSFFAALAYLLVPVFKLRWPPREQALRRLETDSGSPHRPASSWDDEPIEQASPESEALWQLHRQRIAELIKALKPNLPSPRLDRNDPFALRALVLLLLAAGGLAAGTGAWQRVGDAFSLDRVGGAERYRLHAWVTPPVYTGKPPIVLADGMSAKPEGDGGPGVHDVPEGSSVLVRVHGPASARPVIAYNQIEPRKRQPVEVSQTEGEMAEYTLSLSKSGTLSVNDSGRARAAWEFAVAADTAPSIRLLEEPATTPRGALRLVYALEDDYGVTQAEARFALANPARSEGGATALAPDDPLFKPPVVSLRLPSANTQSGEGRTFKNLTSHPWAGLRTRMHLLARDQGGKEGRSKSIDVVLPQRKFTKPLARALVEQRGKLVVSRKARPMVAQALDGLTIAPERFGMDQSVYLALRSAYWRLQRRKDDAALISVVGQLWDVAVRLEDGDLSDAERALQAAQDKLLRAIQDGAPEETIKRLVEELRAALGRFIKSLAENARDRGLGKAPGGNPKNGPLEAKDLDQLLRKIEDLARTGSRDLAQRLLGELRDILERLQMGMMGQDLQRDGMMKAVEGLGEIIKEQQKLLDETYGMKRQQGERRQGAGEREQASPGQGQGQQNQGRAGQGQPKGGQNGKGQGGKGQQGGVGNLADRQSELGKQLNTLMQQLEALGAKPPNKLKGAGRSMGKAKRWLDEGALGRAAQQEGLALDQLRQGVQSMAQQMMKMLGSQMGRRGQRSQDPLGRPDRTQGPDLGSSVKVPDEIDIQRAREILDELRRRLGEPSRPLLELDYLERLIRNY